MSRHPVTAVATALVVALLAACSGGAAPAAPQAVASSAGPSAAASTPASTSASTSAPVSAGDVRTWTAPDGTTIQYLLVVPPSRAVGTPGPVLLTFPPGGQDLDVTRRVLDRTWRAEALARGWVVVSPVAGDKGLFYEKDAAALVPGLLDEVARSYPVEGGRFDLAGVSNGGLSAFRAAQDHPERFRSLVVFPGMPPDAGDAAALQRLRGLGTAFFVGAEDSGWLEGSRDAAKALRALGNRVELTEVAGQGHIIGGLTGGQLFDAMQRVRG